MPTKLEKLKAHKAELLEQLRQIEQSTTGNISHTEGIPDGARTATMPIPCQRTERLKGAIAAISKEICRIEGQKNE